MKELRRRGLRRFGYDVVRYTEMPQQPFDVLKLVVDSRIAAGQSVRFVQIGANDGVTGDPLRELVLKHQLSGIFVEPLPDLFARLQANYAGHPGAIFEQCAMGNRTGTPPFTGAGPVPIFPHGFKSSQASIRYTSPLASSTSRGSSGTLNRSRFRY